MNTIKKCCFYQEQSWKEQAYAAVGDLLIYYGSGEPIHYTPTDALCKTINTFVQVSIFSLMLLKFIGREFHYLDCDISVIHFLILKIIVFNALLMFHRAWTQTDQESLKAAAHYTGP